MIGRKCHEVFQKINRQCNNGNIVCPLHEALRAHQPSQQVLTRLDHNGERCYIEVTLFPIWDKDGRISKFIEISRDITRRKKEEEEITQRLEGMVEQRTRQLRETHAKLLHKDKMASLGKLAASVVHEINNPIAGILNLILLIKRMREEGPQSAEDVRQQGEYLDLMETETRRISRIVSNLLSFSRQSKMELKAVDLNRLIEKTLLLNANLLKLNHIQVEKTFNASDPLIVGSEDQLQQVFMNLLSNAAEAMDPSDGGILRISTGKAEAPRKNPNHLSGQRLRGPPRKPCQALRALFYHQEKRKRGGIGPLGGLRHHQRTRRAYSGRVPPGAGECLHRGVARDRIGVDAFETGGAMSSAKILIVDDERIMRESLAGWLTRDGHNGRQGGQRRGGPGETHQGRSL